MIGRNCTRRCSEKLALISCGQALWVLFSVQCSRLVVSDSVTPWTAACQASLSITNSQGLLKLMSIESVMPSNHLILCRPLLLLPSIFPSIRVFSNESALLIRWPKSWSFSFNISPSNEHPGLISFRMDWFCITSSQNQFWGTQLLRDNCFLFLVLLNWWGHHLWHKIQDIRCTFQVSASQSVQSLSRVWLSVTPMDRSMPGFPVHHQLPELAQTQVHQVGDAIQPPHPLLSPSPPIFNLSQQQRLFQWVGSSHQVAKVLASQFQHQQSWISRTDFL